MIFYVLGKFEIINITVGIALAVAAFLFIVISYAISEKSDTKFAVSLKDSSNSTRVYTIDLANDVVSFFNRSLLRKRRSCSLSEFYNHFPAEEREDLINWVNGLVDKDVQSSQFKEVHLLAKHRKVVFFSLLQVQKVNYKNQIIHLDSYLLKTNPNKKNVNDNNQRFSFQDKFNKALLNNTPNRGITFAFNFYNKRKKDEEIPRIAFLHLKNIINSYISPARPAIIFSSHQIVVSDLHIANRPQLMQLLAKIKTDINPHLMILAFQDSIGYTIGVAENKYFTREPEKLVNNVIALSEAALQDEESIVWYEDGRVSQSGNDNETYRTEVERIIRDKKLKYLFRPIINIDTSKILGYQSFAEPHDSFFESIKELKSYAMRTEDDRVLFATIARNVITRFSLEKNGDALRLFFPLNYSERNYVNRTVSHIPNVKDTHIVLLYSEQELCDLPNESEESVIAEIRTFKSKGYEVALELNDNDLTLSTSIYDSFDFFLIDVDVNLKLDNKSSQKSLYNFTGLVEKLLKYHRPIIAVDIPTWDSVELIYKLGIPLISSEAVSPADENVLPIPPKSITKMNVMKK